VYIDQRNDPDSAGEEHDGLRAWRRCLPKDPLGAEHSLSARLQSASEAHCLRAGFWAGSSADHRLLPASSHEGFNSVEIRPVDQPKGFSTIQLVNFEALPAPRTRRAGR